MPPSNNAAFFHLEPGEYVCYIDASTVDIMNLTEPKLPEGVIIHLVPIRCNPGQSISQAVLMQKMDQMDKFLISQRSNPWDNGEQPN